MVLTLCFDAISRNVDGLGYSPFVMFSMTSLTKLPASLIILLLQDRVGRKAMASGSLLISGVFTIASGIVIACVGAKTGNCHTVNSASGVQQCAGLVYGRCGVARLSGSSSVTGWFGSSGVARLSGSSGVTRWFGSSGVAGWFGSSGVAGWFGSSGVARWFGSSGVPRWFGAYTSNPNSCLQEKLYFL